MDQAITVILEMTKWEVSGFTNGQMVEFMKGNGEVARWMEKGKLSTLMGMFMKEISSKERKKEMVILLGKKRVNFSRWMER